MAAHLAPLSTQNVLSRRRFAALVATAVAGAIGGATAGCSPADELTAEEAKTALEQAAYATQVGALQADFGEISTSFTIAEGVEQAAQNLRDFWKSQAPCADVQLQGLTVTVQWGVKGAGCPWRGKTWTGTTATTLETIAQGQVRVRHDWIAFGDGIWSVSGTDTVTWQSNAGQASSGLQRSSTASWTATGVAPQVAGKVLSGTHTITHQLVDPAQGLAAGVRIDGQRVWTTEQGSWTLKVSGIEARGADPVPQAGRYTLTNPDNKAISMSFARVDATRIRVEVSWGKHQFAFVVRQVGTIEQAKG